MSDTAPRSTMDLFRQLMALAWPVVGLNVLTILALVVDTAMVGRLPEAEVALTGVSFGGQLMFLVMVFMIGLSVGTVAFIARAHGAGHDERVDHILQQSIWLTIGLGLVVGAVGNLGAKPLLELLGATGPNLEAGLAYFRPLLAAATINYLNILLISTLRGLKDTRMPFLVSLASNGLNIVLNYGLILGHYGLPQLGVLGAAIGTIISQAFSVSVLIFLLKRGAHPGLRLRLAPPRPDIPLAKDLVRVGLPAAFDVLVINAGFLTIIGLLGRIDQLSVAAHGIGMRIQALAFVPGMGISQATGALVGNELGAGRRDEARRVTQVAVILCCGVMSVLGFAIIGGTTPILALFDVVPATDLFDYAKEWIFFLGLCMPPVGIYIAYAGAFQGAGATKLSLRINILATLAIQIPLSWILGFPLEMGTTGVWMSFPLSIVVKAVLGWWYFRRDAWSQTGARI